MSGVRPSVSQSVHLSHPAAARRGFAAVGRRYRSIAAATGRHSRAAAARRTAASEACGG